MFAKSAIEQRTLTFDRSNLDNLVAYIFVDTHQPGIRIEGFQVFVVKEV